MIVNVPFDGSETKQPGQAHDLPHSYQHKRLGCPCPGVSILVNHGYLRVNSPDDRIHLRELVDALVECFNLTWIHAAFLSTLAIFICGKGLSVSIKELGRHGGIEHDGSITRHDFGFGNSLDPDPKLISEFIDAKAGPHQISLSDYAMHRSELETIARKPFSLKTRITALGEVGLTMAVFGEKKKVVHSSALHSMFEEERLPPGWCRPQTRVSTIDIVKIGWKLNKKIKKKQKEQKSNFKNRSPNSSQEKV